MDQRIDAKTAKWSFGIDRLLSHPSLLIRAFTGWLIGMAFFYIAWSASFAWLPIGFFKILPGFSLTASAANACKVTTIQEVLIIFGRNLLVGAGAIEEINNLIL